MICKGTRAYSGGILRSLAQRISFRHGGGRGKARAIDISKEESWACTDDQLYMAVHPAHRVRVVHAGVVSGRIFVMFCLLSRNEIAIARGRVGAAESAGV